MKQKIIRILSVLSTTIISLSLLLCCISNEKIDLSQEWELKTPESQQIATAQLETALNNASNYPGLRSLLIELPNIMSTKAGFNLKVSGVSSQYPSISPVIGSVRLTF